MRKLLIASLLINIILITFLFIPAKSDSNDLGNKTEVSDSKDSSMPWLNLDKSYFSIDNLQWGSFTGKVEGDINSYDDFAISNISNYQSYPITSNFEIKNYYSVVKDLNNKTYDEMYEEFTKNNPDRFGIQKVEESYEKFGKLALHYLPEFYITSIEEFDVDSDNIKEKIVTYNITQSATSGSYKTDIIKGNKIVFSSREDNSRIIKPENRNGFYIEWNNTKYSFPRCCEEGFTRTRFVYKDSQFIPVYEQEVRYLKIGSGK